MQSPYKGLKSIQREIHIIRCVDSGPLQVGECGNYKTEIARSSESFLLHFAQQLLTFVQNVHNIQDG